ncbi:hypothetical protein ACTXON_07400 [Brachybacterium alimentarium]|uniref:hypothetical protein n=1 Tax=Brachybacterium alimentarium TaxID=47845 RepID=UPI003FD5D007
MSTNSAAPSPVWGPVPSGERWGSGRWSLDLRSDELADIRCDGLVVLRGVRAVARDADWLTAASRVTHVERSSSSLVMELEIADRGIDVAGALRVEADGDQLAVTFEGAARSDSPTNRTGLVVLHPPHLAGTDLTVGRTDGTELAMTFPAAISPHQPARDIAALSWADHGTTFRVDLRGDVFEMEDQRNWSDASFKTYNRSLDEPFPYTLAAGETVRQQVILTAAGPTGPLAPAQVPATVQAAAAGATGPAEHAEPTTTASVTKSTGAPDAGTAASPTVLTLVPCGPFPTIAVGASTAPEPGPQRTGELRDVLHVELDLADPAWSAALERARREADGLSVMLVSPTPPETAVLRTVLGTLADVDLHRIGIVDASSHVSEPALVEALRAVTPPGIPVVAGSRSHYTELNREWDRLPHADLDGLTFPITPLFHTLETEQLVESVAMQRVIVEDATSRAPGVPVHIGPVTLRPRFNNVATRPVAAPARTGLSAGYGAHRTAADDARQACPELATWTIASAAALAVPGVASLTCLEQWGPRGVRTADGADLPVRAAIDALSALEGGQLLTAASPDGLVWAIGARRSTRLPHHAQVQDQDRNQDQDQDQDQGCGTPGHHDEVLLANLSGYQRRVELRTTGADTSRHDLGAFEWARSGTP